MEQYSNNKYENSNGFNRKIRPEHIYLIKGKIYSNIVSCKRGTYYNSPIWRVTFLGDDGIFTRSYNIHDVACLDFNKTYTGNFRYRDDNNRYGIIHTVHEYTNESIVIYGLESNNGFVSYRSKEQCKLESSIRDHKTNVLTYLESLAGLSKIGVGEEKGISLADKYAAAKFIFKGSLLAKYLDSKKSRLEYNRAPKFMVFPFGCNQDQYNAVKRALTSDLSVIQGPPGTGKTQTILNIAANLIIQGKSTIIVSNNNSAVLNINDKLKSYGYDFLVAFLGKSENKERFFNSQTGSYPTLNNWQREETKESEIKKVLTEISKQLPEYFVNIQRIAVLKELIAEYERQSTQIDIPKQLPKCQSKKLFALLLSIEDNLRRNGKISLINKLKSWKYGFGFNNIDRKSIETAAHCLNHKENQAELTKLVNKCQKISEQYKNYIALSKEYFELSLYKRFGTLASRRIFTNKDLMTFSAQDFIKEYPIVLSTTFSATSNISQTVPFDTIIMDEASQVDIAAGALSLNCANSAVIVGDDKQLPNVVTKEIGEKADSLYSQFGMSPEYKFSGNSFLSSVQKVFPNAPVTLLREHYRCEPRIIGFCNSRFYGGLLIPMTKRSEKPSLTVIKTVKGNHAVGKANQRQAEETVLEVKRLSQSYKSIGVIVPYNEQATIINNLLCSNGLTEIPVSTVHKFQGREEDAIVLCTVDNTISEFIDDPHLLNVAVSRAKKHFSIVVNGNDTADGNIGALVKYIENCEGIVREGKIKSVFDILYKQYQQERESFVKAHANVSSYISENIMMNLLNEITSMPKFQHLGIMFQYPLSQLVNVATLQLTNDEAVYTNHSWTLLDFLIFDVTTKQPILVIEVDGMSYHKKGSRQWERDQLKNSVLSKADIPLLRLSTKGSDEKGQIIRKLTELCSS